MAKAISKAMANNKLVLRQRNITFVPLTSAGELHVDLGRPLKYLGYIHNFVKLP